jgi:stage IV sporulation protein FB
MIVARVFGVRLRVNILFFLLLVLYAVAGLLAEAAVIFAAVILHELWHTVVAAGHGFDIDEVELLPFGGVARLRGLIEVNPTVEFRTAVAGPLASLTIAAATLGLFSAFGGLGPYARLFLVSNLSVGLFNLLPVIPLDGGRMLRASLVRRYGFIVGSRTSGRISGVVLVIVAVAIIAAISSGLVSVVTSSVIVFLLLAWRRERANGAYILFRYLVRRESEILTDRVMAVQTLVATKDVTIREVLQLITPQRYHMIVVLDSDLETLGTIGEKQLLDSFLAGNADVPLEVLL